MNLVALPILVPLSVAAVTLLAPARVRRALLVLGAFGTFAAALLLGRVVLRDDMVVLHVGGWLAPLGISLAADVLSAVLVLLNGVVGVAVALVAVRQLDDEEARAGSLALVSVLFAGVNAAFLAADLFHLYVSFEIMLIASFALLGIGRGQARREATVTYLLPNLLSSTLLLGAVGLLYGVTGTLNMADVAVRLAEAGPSLAVSAAAGMLAVAFLIKSAAFPFFAWLPASYSEGPPVLTALFSALLTKVGVYALLRVFTVVLPAEMSWLGPTLLTLAVPTMVLGVLGAMGQWGMQRLLSFHVVSQVGYLLIGVGLGTPLALAATVYYLVHNSLAKCGLLLGAGIVRARRGTDQLKSLGGIARSEPWLAGLFLVSALALAGIPPLSGFWGKLAVFRAGLDVGSAALVGVAAVVSLLTLMSMTKIWIYGFWGAPPTDAPRRTPLADLAPLVLLAGLSIGLGLFAGPAFDLAQRTADQLSDPGSYVSSILEGRR